MSKDFLIRFFELTSLGKGNRRKFLFILLIGVLAQVSLIFPSGLFWRGGYQFWGVQFHDGLWHLSLAQKLKHFSLENPVYAGETIANYHYFSNLIIALISNLTGISIFDVFFRIYPIFISFLIGLFTFKLSRMLFKNEIVAIWSMFFVYLSSNFSYLLPFFGLGYSILETVFWVQQPISIFANIPFSASVPIILASFYYLSLYLELNLKKYLIITTFLLGLALPTKSFSVIFIFAYLFVGFVRAITKKKFELLISSLTSFVFGIVLIYPTFTFKNYFIFEPGWFLRAMVEAPDRMNWQSWALRYQFYKAHYDIFNLAWFYLVAFLIFLFGNLGTRAIMFFGFPKFKEIFKSESHLILTTSLVLSVLIPNLFVTTGVAWNAIQFMYYFLLIAAIYSGNGLFRLISKFKGRILRVFITALVVILTIPIDVYTLWFYYHHSPDRKIEGGELSALNSLSNVGSYKDVVLTFPLEESFIEVSGFTGKSTFLGDWLQAIVPGHDYDGRLKKIKESMKNETDFKNFLYRNNISWIYIKGEEPEIISQIQDSIRVYYSGDIKIYHVEKI